MTNYTNAQENLREYKGLTIVREDPYGFWRIYKDGRSPSGLSDAFTQISLAIKAIDAGYVEPIKVLVKKKV